MHNDEAQAMRQAVLEAVRRFYRVAHQRRPFIPGQTRVHYGGRVYDEEELVALVDAALDFWLTLGPKAEEFERRLGEYLGIKHVILVNSGSSANLVAVAALCSRELDNPLRPGDEVITPAVTFPTTVAPLVLYGLVPVFVDCELGTYNIDPDAVADALSERTRALFIPHTLGNPADMERLMEIARRHGLFVIEDACDALGSCFAGQLVGTFGDFGTFSFYPAHHITTGEGGAVVTNDDCLARIARSIRDWGRACYCTYRNTNPNGACGRRFEYEIPGMPGTYDHRYLYSNIGFNLRPTDLQAAIGVVQMDKLPQFIQQRKHNFLRLYEGLARYQDFLILPQWDPRAEVAWFAFPITVRDNLRFTRNDLVRHLEASGVETRFLFAGNIIRQPGYRDIRYRVSGPLTNSDLVMRGSFFVGVYPGLDDARLDYMLGVFGQFFR